MALKEEIDSVIIPFGDKLAIDLKASLEAALKQGGSKNVQESAITFQPEYVVTNDATTIKITTQQDYWYYIEHGRKAGKMPPPNKLGKEWQTSQKIDPRRVIAEINIKNKKKPSKTLSFDKATKQLSFIIARSIGKKGFKPRPFIDRILNDGRIAQLTKDIAKVMNKDIVIQLTRP